MPVRAYLERNYWLSALIPLLLFSANAVISKYLMTDGSSAMEVLFYRSCGAVLFGLVIMRARLTLTWRLVFSLPGLMMLANIACYNMALKYISGYLVMVLESTCFVFSLLFALCGREKVRVPWGALVLMALGFGLLFWHAAGETGRDLWLGLFWGIMTSATFGIFNSTILYGPKDAPRLYVMLVPSLLFSLPCTAWEWSLGGMPSLGMICVLVLVSGCLITGLPYLLWGIAATHFRGERLSQLFLLTLPGTFLAEWLFLGSSVSWEELLASVLLIGSIFLNSTGKKPEPNAADTPRQKL